MFGDTSRWGDWSKNPALTESQKEILKIWDNLSTKEQETVLAMLRGLQK
jgi:hypothetical protein